jgi:predicted ArsR family transcriptional regulator
VQNCYKLNAAKEGFSLRGASSLGKVDEQIFEVLKSSGSPLTLSEIAEKMGKPSKTVFKGLRKLFEQEKIDCDHKTHRYFLAKPK